MSDDRIERTRDWKIQIALIVFVIYLYVLLEWIFYLTKPSFLEKLDFIDKIRVLIVSPIPLVVFGLAMLFLCFIPFILTRKETVLHACSIAASIIILLIVVAASFLLIDNFTYTVMRFGVRNIGGVSLASYWFLLLGLAFFLYLELRDLNAFLFRKFSSRAFIGFALGMVIVSIAFSIVGLDRTQLKYFRWNEEIITLENAPNIVVLSTDGLNADHMSLYGYERETTPYLDEISENLLLCENSFTNADATCGSLVSILTGKLPTRTRLLFPPQILMGDDAYQHLPGILKKHGYRNSDISTRHHVDPIDMNMLNSFHWANGRNIEQDRLKALSLLLLGDKSVYFLGQMRERIMNRLLHILNIRRMRDPLAEVGRYKLYYNRDVERIRDLFAHLDRSNSPFFVHAHLLGTHGPQFHITDPVFSVGKKETDKWMTDFYDDAILRFDGIVKRLMKKLEDNHISHNTIVIICTDHGQRWTVDDLVPLIFIFPHGEHSGAISANTQYLDIAPTILDYLGVPKPEWMGGISLLSSNVESSRFIFTTTRKHGLIKNTHRGPELDVQRTIPPFYSIGSVGVFFHQKYYKLLLKENEFTISDMEGHTAPCGDNELPDPQEIGRMIIDHLDQNGFDTSSIKTPLTVENVQ